MRTTGKRHILLVEDNDDDAFLTKRACQAGGISLPIHHCRDGQEVIDYLEHLPAPASTDDSELPDLILLDLKIPRLNGLEVLDWIRSHKTLNSLVVLALTSSSEQQDVLSAYRLHINAYLVKPSSLSEMTNLARSIREFWLDQKQLITPLTHFLPSIASNKK